MKNGYQPRLLDYYSHLVVRHRGAAAGRGPVPAYGTIKKLVGDRGFGFIRPDGLNQDLFFHRSSVEEPTFEDLKEGDAVQFSIQKDHLHNENQAVKIRVAQRPIENQSKKVFQRRGSMRTEYRSLEYRSRLGTSRANSCTREEE